MPYGYNGKILRINLSNKTVEVEEPNVSFYRKYMGGNGFISRYLLDELEVGIDPLSEKNKLIIAVSVMTGAPLAGFARQSIGAKSPLTGYYGVSEGGGFWGPEFKFSGYDAMIIDGKAESPVYIYINDSEVEIRSADKLWGMVTGDAVDAIKEELGEPRIRVLSIGPAGENMVRFAGVASDTRNYNGRTGMGAVFGSKNLKAVAVRGTKKPEYADNEKIKELAKYFADNYLKNADNKTLNKYGTSAYYFGANGAGGLPTKNFRKGYADLDFTLDEMHEKLKVHTHGCYACPVRCKQVFSAEKPFKVDPRYGGPEFETCGAFGSNCDNMDMFSMAKGHEMCNKLGLDTISTGLTIAFAMECFEKGLITKEQTDGIDLRFGNAEAMVEMIEKIAYRDGFGDVLAEGSWRVANDIGNGAQKYSISTKGLELALCDPRVKNGVALIYTVNPLGGDHLVAEHDGCFDPLLSGYSHAADDPGFFMNNAKQIGVSEPVSSLSLGPEKVHLVTNLQHWWSLFDALDLCIFVFGPVRTFKPMMIVDMINAVTGWETTMYELMKVGERITNVQRAFNIIHADIKREDDNIPERLFDGLENGPMEGAHIDREEHDKAKTYYYEMMGWDRENGVPSAGKLFDLELGDVVEKLKAKLGERYLD